MTDLPILKQLIELLHWILVNLHDWFSSIGLSEHWTWGLAIIGLTVVVRLVLFPLTWKQFSSAQAMQAVQPKIKELQRKYKSDRAKLQAETMKLYQEHRVNPFASCLPILLQLPVFIALYYAIRGTDYLDKATTVALSNASFLWIDKLGDPDPTYILLVLYIVSQLISTELMLTPQTDKQQKYIMRAMPIIFVFMLYRFPAGLFVYWVTTNLWTIGQQLIIKRVMKPHVLDAARPVKRSRIMDVMMQAQGDRAKTREDTLARRRAFEEAGADAEGGGAKGAAGQAGRPAKKGGARPTGKPRGGKRTPPGKGKSKSGPTGG